MPKDKLKTAPGTKLGERLSDKHNRSVLWLHFRGWLKITYFVQFVSRALYTFGRRIFSPVNLPCRLELKQTKQFLNSLSDGIA